MQSEFQYRCSISCSRKPTNQTRKKAKTQCRQNELHLEPYNNPFLPWQNLLHFNFLWSSFRHIWWWASKAQHYRRKNGAFQGVYKFQRSLSCRAQIVWSDWVTPSRVTWKIHSIWSNSRYYVRAMLRLQGICFVVESKHQEVLAHTYAPFPQKRSPVVKLKNGRPIH